MFDNKNLLVVVGVGTALLGSFPSDANSDLPQNAPLSTNYSVVINSYSETPAELELLDNSYVNYNFTVFDLAKDLSSRSRNFSNEEANGYENFINNFFT